LFAVKKDCLRYC